MKKRYRIIPEVHIIVKKDDKVLLCRRYNTGYEDGKFHFPAGHVENNESPQETAIREIKEEANLTVNKKDLQCVHVMYRNFEKEIDRIAIYFQTDHFTGIPKIVEQNKCDKVDWFPVDNFPKNTIFYVKKAYDFINKKQMYSEVREM